MTLDEARALMHEWVSSDALRIHMEAVSCCVGAYAQKLDPGDEERWRIAALLHDFDYERYPKLGDHPFVGVKELERLGVDEDIRTAILGHADFSGVPRETPMAKALYACDELAGFIVACCKVRPNGIADLEPKSVKKKLKDKAFAAAVNRDDITRGVGELGPVCGVDDPAAFTTQHIQTCIDAMRRDRELLGV
ncbi:MAG TPA: HD domain-containing protein [Actinomycetota bacterium]|nr:HD domain-containing protein [Actinomycetota bacterium]